MLNFLNPLNFNVKKSDFPDYLLSQMTQYMTKPIYSPQPSSHWANSKNRTWQNGMRCSCIQTLIPGKLHEALLHTLSPRSNAQTLRGPFKDIWLKKPLTSSTTTALLSTKTQQNTAVAPLVVTPENKERHGMLQWDLTALSTVYEKVSCCPV